MATAWPWRLLHEAGARGGRPRHRDPPGSEVIADLLDDVRRRLPGVDVITAWVELLLDEVMSGMGRPTVVVAILLSTGYHVTTDVPAAAALSGAPVLVAAPLGPDRHLARATTARIGCSSRPASLRPDGSRVGSPTLRPRPLRRGSPRSLAVTDS